MGLLVIHICYRMVLSYAAYEMFGNRTYNVAELLLSFNMPTI